MVVIHSLRSRTKSSSINKKIEKSLKGHQQFKFLQNRAGWYIRSRMVVTDSLRSITRSSSIN